MRSLKFLGIHSGNLPTENEQKTSVPTSRTYWFVWFNQKEQNYVIQVLDQFKRPQNSPFIISAIMFGLNFIEENVTSFQTPPLPDVATLKNYEKDIATNYKRVNISTNSKESPSENEILTVKQETQVVASSDQVTHIQANTVSEDQISYTQSMLSEDNKQRILQSGADTQDLFLKPKYDADTKLKNSRALRLDKECKTDFASAMVLWRQGKKGAAAVQFNKLLKKDGPFFEAHKHMFTDCAIQLRKINQNDLALAFAIRCTKLSPADSHTYFNVGRMYYELRDYKSSIMFLENALALEPDLMVAIKLKAIGIDTLSRISTKN